MFVFLLVVHCVLSNGIIKETMNECMNEFNSIYYLNTSVSIYLFVLLVLR